MRSGTLVGPGIWRKWRPEGWPLRARPWASFIGWLEAKLRNRILYAKVRAGHDDRVASRPHRHPTAQLRMQLAVPEPPAPNAAVLAIGRRALHQEVAERLRGLLTEGKLAPGERLNERVLCEQLKVSRTPLREALKVLATERLVELSPNRGARVVALSRSAVAELFELMAALEGLA